MPRIQPTIRPLAVALVAVAITATATRRPPVRGMTYTMHGITVPSGIGGGPGATPVTGANSEWTAVVVWADGRGRMDIVEGKQPMLFEQGDYVLFDSTDFIVVHPTAMTFFGKPADVATAAMKAAQSTGLTMKFTNVRASLDTLAGGDVLGTRTARHYRIKTAFAVAVDLSGAGVDLDRMTPPPLETEMTTEYWFGDTADIPPNPFIAMSDPARAEMAGLSKDLSDRVSALRRTLPPGKVALRTRITTRMENPAGGSQGTDYTVEIGGVKRVDVDVARLVLPAGISETVMPGMESLFPGGAPLSRDGGAKWRVRPAAGR